MTIRSKKHLITTFITGFFAVASPCVTQALPSISSVSGTFTDGNMVTVSGSGFGANGPNVHFFDNFEGGTVGQTLKTGSGSATVGQWSGFAEPGPYYTNMAAVSGNLAFQVDRSIEGPSAYGRIDLPNTTEVFYSWWQYIPAGDKWPGEDGTSGVNWKTMWLQKSSPFDNDVWTPVMQDAGTNWVFGGNDSRNWGTGQRWMGNSKIQMEKGKWKRMWFWGKGDPGATTTNGAWRIWVLRDDGVLLAGWGDNANLLQVGGYWEQLHVFGYGRAAKPCRPTYDDIYVASGPHAQARIEIGNQPDYNASTNIAISTPNLWSDTQVKFTFRKGSFTTGQTAYLFIFDGNGTVNSQGLPIKIGGDASGGGSSLTVPSNLQIK